MSGKNRQRTKGNIKPSSSQKSTQLLVDSGILNIGAFSFSSSLAAATSKSETVDELSIDPEIRAVFNQLSKKDSITKQKALQKFHDLCSDELLADKIKCALPFWPRYFSKLATDNDKQVRECVQIAQEALVEAVGKDLRKILKAIAGVWFVAMHDPHPPVATSAADAFRKAFPADKKIKAILFALDEILDYIRETLLVDAQKNVSGNTAEAKESSKFRHEMLTVSSLMAYASLLESTSPAEHKKKIGKHRALVEDSRFWKLAKEKSPKIQFAWFIVVRTLCEYLPELAADLAPKIVPSVFLSIDLDDPTVLPAVWMCAVVIVKNIKNCWDYINMQKAGLLTKMKNLAKMGCYGCATAIMPFFVVILGKLPLEHFGNQRAALEEVCSSIIESFTLRKIQLSPLEFGAMISAFVDVIHISMATNHTDLDFCLELERKLFSVIEESILHKPSFFANSPLSHCVAEKLELWNKNPQKFGTVSEEFRNSVRKLSLRIITANISACDAGLTSVYVIERLADFLCTLHSPEKYKGGKICGKVRFKTSSSSGENLKFHEFGSHAYDSALDGIVIDIAKLCITLPPGGSYGNLVRFLGLILRDFSSETLFQSIYSELNGKEEFLRKFCVPALIENHSDGELLFLNVLFDLSEDQRLNLLEDWSKTELSSTILLLVKIILDSNHSDPSVETWLSSNSISDLLIKVATSLIQGNQISGLLDEEKWHLIGNILAPPECLGYQIKTATQVVILKEFGNFISEGPDPRPHFENVLKSLACVLETKTPYWSCLPSADDFLVHLLRLVCNPRISIDSLVKSQLLSIWSLSLDKGHTHRCENAIKILQEIVVSSQWTVCELNEIIADYDFIINNVVGVSVVDGDRSIRCLLKRAKDLFKMILPQDFSSSPSDATDCWALRLAMEGELTICKDLSSNMSLIKVQESYVNLSLLRKYARLDPKEPSLPSREELIKTPYMHMDDSDSGTEEVLIESVMYDVEGFEYIIQNAMVGHAFSELVFRQILALSLCEQDKCLSTQSLCDSLMEEVEEILKCSEESQQKRIISFALKDARKNGLYSALALNNLLKILLSKTKFEKDPLFEDIRKYVDIIELSHKGDLNTYETLVSGLAKKHAKDMCFQCCGTITESGIEKSMNYFILLTKALSEVGVGQIFASEEPGLVALLRVVLDSVNMNLEMEGLSLLNMDLASVPNEKLSTIIAYARLFSVLMTKASCTPSMASWNLMLQCLLDWIKKLKTTFMKAFSRKEFDKLSIGTLSFGGAVMKLLGDTCQLIEKLNLNPDWLNRVPDSMLKNWNELFAEAICSQAWSLILEILRQNEMVDSQKLDIFVNVVAKHISSIPVEQMADKRLDEQSHLKSHWLGVLKKILPFIRSKKRGSQVVSYNLAKKVILQIVIHDENSKADSEETKAVSLPHTLCDILRDLANQIKESFGPSRPGYLKINIEDVHTLLCFLFTWNLVLRQCAYARTELRNQYANFLHESGLLKLSLDILVYLLPSGILQEKEVDGVKVAAFVADELELSTCEPYSLQQVHHGACRAFALTLQHLPSLSRQWYSLTDKHTAQLVEEFTSHYVSPMFCSQEMKAVQEANTTFTNMAIRVRPSVREVVASYVVEDASMELLIQLPPHHPLGQISVEATRKVGIPLEQWRYWMLQLKAFLMNQNGSIYNGLLLWKGNVDKRFEGLEECSICYCILHGSAYHLPKLQCKICKKKFHSACLYKWFNTSNKSSCPLCRNPF